MKRQAPVLDRDALTAEIAGLSKATITDLRDRWKAMFGKTPSHDISRSFLTRAIAYRLQEKAIGGLQHSTRRLLDDQLGNLAPLIIREHRELARIDRGHNAVGT